MLYAASRVLALLVLVCMPGSRLAKRSVENSELEISINFKHLDSNLASFIRFAEIIDIAFAVVMVFT